MKEEKKPDNLEDFFQRVLQGHEEDPGADFWDRIAPNIPPKPTGKPPFVFKGWMVLLAFLGGLLSSTFLLNWHFNTRLIDSLKEELLVKEAQIVELEQTVTKLNTIYVNEEKIGETISHYKIKTEKITRQTSKPVNKLADKLDTSKKSIPNFSNEKEQSIKLEIARQTSVEPATLPIEESRLRPFTNREGIDQLFEKPFQFASNYQSMQLLFDNQLISNSFFAGNNGVYKQEKEPIELGDLDQLPTKEKLTIDYPINTFDLTESDKKNLLPTLDKVRSFGLGEDELTSFITATFNPFSGYKYNLKGYTPQLSAISESAGITSSWNWSFYGGFETKSKWSVQVGLDFNKVVIVRESLNNIRFSTEAANRVEGGHVFSFNQRSDGALGQVVVNTSIFNQWKNDGNDIVDGDLFKLSISTEQPVKIIRLPIMGGYRIDLSKRFYVTPKLGVSAVWRIKEQTELKSVRTFSDRISIRKTDIFLTNTTTTESLEAIVRTEFGYRWRPRWYIIAEPRFKYSGKPLFNYRQIELDDSRFLLMFGIRFNID